MGEFAKKVHTDDGQIKLDFHCASCGQHIKVEMPCPACGAAMDETKAREILGKDIRGDGGLRPGGRFWAGWNPGDEHIALDDGFTADELEAIAWWMRNKGDR